VNIQYIWTCNVIDNRLYFNIEWFIDSINSVDFSDERLVVNWDEILEKMMMMKNDEKMNDNKFDSLSSGLLPNMRIIGT